MRGRGLFLSGAGGLAAVAVVLSSGSLVHTQVALRRPRTWSCWITSGGGSAVFPAAAVDETCLTTSAERRLDASHLGRSRLESAASAPAAPSALTGSANGRTVSLAWMPAGSGDPATSYVLEAGASSGTSDVATVDTGSAVPSLVATDVAPGTYFIRVRARNAGGTSGPSNEVVVMVLGACVGLPGPPAALTATANGSSVVLAWQAPAGSCPPTAYFIDAGTAPGLSNLASFSTGSSATTFSASGVADGTYYVRVRSGNGAGSSGPSNEVQLVVGATSAPARFKTGIYYRLPGTDTAAARLGHVGESLSEVVPQVPQMPPIGWDMCSDYLVFPTQSGLTLVTPSGQQRAVPVTDIFFLARPSLSADCRYVAVQAQATPAPTVPGANQDLNIYVIDLQSGTDRRIGSLAYNEESPRFFPSGHRLAYSSFSPTEGTNLHVYDLDQNREAALFRDIGALQIAISPDGTQFLDPRVMRIYRLDTGAVVSDLLTRVVQSLQAAGFQLDQRFNDPTAGHPNRGVYPLDAAFSPGGDQLVLDWAVSSAGTYGNLLVTMSVSGAGLAVVLPLTATNPLYTNSNNFSQLNPLWK